MRGREVVGAVGPGWVWFDAEGEDEQHCHGRADQPYQDLRPSGFHQPGRRRSGDWMESDA